MKNNKTTQIFLAIALLGIWGTIFYRVYVGMESDGENNFQTWQLPIIDTTAAIEEAGFALRLDYGDPFFGRTYEAPTYDEFAEMPTSSGINTITQAPPATNLSKQKKKNIQFPKIVYQGLVTNKQTNQQVAILKINQKTHRLQSGQKVDDIQLTKMHRDSVRIYYKGVFKTFLK
jgi:hypothetical protein